MHPHTLSHITHLTLNPKDTSQLHSSHPLHHLRNKHVDGPGQDTAHGPLTVAGTDEHAVLAEETRLVERARVDVAPGVHPGMVAREVRPHHVLDVARRVGPEAFERHVAGAARAARECLRPRARQEQPRPQQRRRERVQVCEW